MNHGIPIPSMNRPRSRASLLRVMALFCLAGLAETLMVACGAPGEAGPDATARADQRWPAWDAGDASTPDQGVTNPDLSRTDPDLSSLADLSADARPPDGAPGRDASACVNACGTAGETRCNQGRVRRCERDELGCLRWSAALDCPVAFCADSTSCRSAIPLGCSRATPPTCARLELNDPRDYQVVQRDGRNGAEVVIRGRLSASGARIRLVAQSADGKQVASEVREVDAAGATGSFQTSLRLPAGGWYRLWVQETPADGRRALAETVVEHLGVGEVFLTAGQSNSVAAGEAPQTGSHLSSGATLQGNTAAWSATIDPPGAPGGTPWPTFAAMLVGEIGIPVAVMSVGCGGTSSKQWLPADLGADPVHEYCGAEAARPGALYQRLVRGVRALGNLRAILWHQGESDASSGTTTAEYRQRLQQIIARLKADSGASQQWIVANASYIPGSEIDANTCALRGSPLQHYDKMGPVRAAQQWLWTHGVVHRGPDTDGLIGKAFRYPGARGACIHFSDAGLRVHGALWYQAVGDAGIVPGMSGPPTVATHLLYRYVSSRDHYLTPASTDLSGYGYRLEGPAMRVYSAPPAKSHTLYPCILAGASHFLSTDAACESHARDGEPVGYLSQGAAVGTTLLYRFISPSPRTDLLSTVLLDEGYGAGYILQGIQGFTPR
jgi:hypothetical protein